MKKGIFYREEAPEEVPVSAESCLLSGEHHSRWFHTETLAGYFLSLETS